MAMKGISKYFLQQREQADGASLSARGIESTLDAVCESRTVVPI
jgi:hypothetical protein